ncbi:HET-domain-containing protein, partial [Hyaloscypha bicolor E]
MLKFIFAARDTGALPPYQYSKLATSESIRIIALHQAEAFNDPLHCTIITKDRPGLYKLTDNCLNYYEAISYAWGIPEFTKALICNGNSVSKITPNVDNMLRRLRKKHRVRYLWIDAISLNQADKEEKAQQVPLMSKIYNQAARVLIWLGDEKHCIKESFALIRSFALAQYDNVRIEELITSLPEDWHLILNSLLDRPWFRRRWILQEVAQSRNTTIQCHTEEIGWVWLVDAVSYLKSHTSIQNQPKLSSHSFHALDTVQNIQGKNTDWLDLLWNLDHAECSDPNDRLFALYGLAKSTPENLTPAIDCKIGWNINFTNFATKCAVNGRWFNLVQHVAAFG